MRDITNKSIKLNRQLDKLLIEAMKKDLLVKIGWGRDQDEKPRNGEIGAITHLPAKSKVLLLGNLGECAGAMNRGGIFTLQGSATSMLGAFQDSGKIIVERDVGDKIGYHMKGGTIVVQGSVGNEAGGKMSGGNIIVRGHAGDRLGSKMSGGIGIILGSTGSEPGLGMTGGKLIIAGSCPPPGEDVLMRSVEKDEIEYCNKELNPLGLSINEDALVLESAKEENMKDIDVIPISEIVERMENIILVPDNNERIPEHKTVDNYTLILPNDPNSEGILFKVPWLVECETAKKWKGAYASKQPALVSKNPREIDFVNINSKTLIDSTEQIIDCAGIIIDMAEMPDMNDAELEAIIVSLASRMKETSMIFLKNHVNRIKELFRLVIELKLDGAVVDASAPGGSRVAACLPTIGLAVKSWNFKENNLKVFIKIDKQPSVKEMLVSVASGCVAIVGPEEKGEIEKDLELNELELKEWMHELGIDGLEKIGRRNLRASNYDTAAISGLRLVGYNKSLPMWLGN